MDPNECNHMCYQRFYYVHRSDEDKVTGCVTCSVKGIQEASARALRGYSFDIVEFRIARNHLELEEILLESKDFPVPAAYQEYRAELFARRPGDIKPPSDMSSTLPEITAIRLVRQVDLLNYDHSTSIGSSPVRTPTCDKDQLLGVASRPDITILTDTNGNKG